VRRFYRTSLTYKKADDDTVHRQSFTFEVGDKLHIQVNANAKLNGNIRSTKVHHIGEVIEESNELIGILKGQVQVLAERGVHFDKGRCKKDIYVAEANKEMKKLRADFRENPSDAVLLQKICDAPDVFEIRDARDATHCACSCCALTDQDDFKNQASAIEEFFEGTKHKCVFLPKFHPELNFIERSWSAVKRYIRANCDGTIAALVDSLGSPGDRLGPAFMHMTIAQLRRYSRTCWHYCMAYEKELDFVEADYFMKQFRRHRNYSKHIDMSLDDYFIDLTTSDVSAPADCAADDDDIDRDVVVPPPVDDQSEDDDAFEEAEALLADATATIAMLESVNASIVFQC
jgi:hypothetical protein